MIGTLLAAASGLLLALPASRTHAADKARWRGLARLLLNVLRSVPELMWAALLLVAAGLGPFALVRRSAGLRYVGVRPID